MRKRTGGRRDHPRSRGVYDPQEVLPPPRAGSSPLARGLPDRGRTEQGHPRIIPARAGFTRVLSSAVNPIWDHPRSRGVYLIMAVSQEPPSGSSPLARGLLPRARASVCSPGIIPARAGFTRRRGSPCRRTGDHPRSRGVYSATWVTLSPDRGSSPLARGLLIAAHIVEPTGVDHPRSRGVYGEVRLRRLDGRGSSPLARGLRLAELRKISDERIIPARAGFTEDVPGGVWGDWDHPRSRGVYETPRLSATSLTGSSPLARGLLIAKRQTRESDGIIPARAGFTPTSPSGRRQSRDHPRSRGVYLPLPRGRLMFGGSSPLARGLPLANYGQELCPGIIPARAGFTLPRPPPQPWSRDHPRSRGVYAVLPAGVQTGNGSSPLARGLLCNAARVGVESGIIPARAGFTAWKH